MTPLSATNRPVGKAYLFYDTAYVPGMPVPVLKMRAVKWPAAASRAAFRIWCQPQPIDSEIVPLAKLLIGTGAAGKAVADANHLVSGWSIRASLHSGEKRVVLRIIQQTDGKRAKSQPLKIAFPSVQASRITRQFDTGNGIVLHSFEFAPGKEAMVRAGALRISTQEAVKKNALHFVKPASVDVREKGESLRLTVPPPSAKN